MRTPKIFFYGLAALGAAFLTTGCGGGGGGAPAPQPTPTPMPSPVPVPSPTPFPTLDPSQPTPTPGTPPSIVFDLRGRVLQNGAPVAGASVSAVGAPGAVTSGESTTTGADGTYLFFLGAGTYTLTASNGTLSSARTVTIPPGGQTVDNFDLTL